VQEIKDQNSRRHVRPWLPYRNNETDVSYGLRALLYDSVCSQIMDTLTGGAFLVAFALLLGASNTVVGLLAAISPLTQLLQLPAIYLVDRMASRKTLVVFSSFFSRVFWFAVAVVPWLVADEQRLSVLLVCLFFYFGLASISACGFNPWIRDFVPEKIMGRYFGKCLAVATAAGVLIAVPAGMGIEIGKSYSLGQFIPYAVLFIVGGMFGLAGVYFLTRIPEPRITAHKPQGVLETLAQPIRDLNFRRLLMFFGTWFFAINLAGPFYAVYMIKQLELSMSLVVGLTALSQIMSVLSFRIWGRAADTFSNKSVLLLSGHLYIISVLLWPFLALPQPYFLMIPLLAIIHVLIGISSAGLSLCTGNIALQAAPQGKATSFLALNTLVHGIAAATAPILGGIIADGLTGSQLSLAPYLSLAQSDFLSNLPDFGRHGLHFIFFFAAILGLYAMRRLRVVNDGREVKGQVVISYFATEARKGVERLSSTLRLTNPNSRSPISRPRSNPGSRFLDRIGFLLFGNEVHKVPLEEKDLSSSQQELHSVTKS
jgi:MFS family permease